MIVSLVTLSSGSEVRVSSSEQVQGGHPGQLRYVVDFEDRERVISRLQTSRRLFFSEVEGKTAADWFGVWVISCSTLAEGE